MRKREGISLKTAQIQMSVLLGMARKYVPNYVLYGCYLTLKHNATFEALVRDRELYNCSA